MESILARRITLDLELAEVFKFAVSNPTMRLVMCAVGFKMALEEFIAQKERFTFITFDAAAQPTPAPIKADLWWVWIILIPACLSLGFFTTL